MKNLFLVFFLFAFANASNLESVRQALTKEFQNNFPKLSITQIELKSTSLPKDFENYKFLRIANAKLNKAQGFIRAEFITPQNIHKNIFFRYFIQANLEVLRANRPIKKGQRLTELDYDLIVMDFDKVPLNALEATKNLIAKTNINKNTVLKDSMFKAIALIHKNDSVVGILNAENVNVLIELIALENGNIGEKIKAKNKEGKTIQGVVVDKKRILLQ
ncbi:flagellar basal body P-ring formation chaperone FlgA [Campylobacter sp. MIT 21-1685]|uniref:flagellar basal body P-ring formation chaperone FlgA n=1 Tax=unclassified Campylobacter TaxID=2593542 RepID=UPI00224A74F2|nr:MULTISPECIES: flagellar basal body P-ring formation chaperone FlgA [unclassified Campylobacter]MCX2683004.1 flagellar basal body P-ring formation chaperone FlgA [Campylobacter sp. MIT 21-1684]MCX2751286.1 flagellar basal body P-ring formation chaperone FlgA [Campylobacter sp. MIT 21-1682]MCX2807485.1 flagellar basal body P-ring formation chaperone FlgA [Campylobacter sp. MIT 21-1685]